MREEPLAELEESRMFGLWPKRLLIFEDRVETRGMELLRETVESRSYEQVDRVTAEDGAWFANLLIGSRTGRPLMRGLDEDAARRAEALVKERVSRAGDGSSRTRKSPATRDAAGLVRKLAELRDAGLLTREEFEAKRRKVGATEQQRR